MTFTNLLTIKEFKPLLQHFKLGNWIRVGVEEKVYRLRLVTIQINFGSSQTIDVEFSDVTKTASGMNDIRSLLNSAQSMATSYTSVSRQSSKGNDANNKIVDMQKEGFDSALYNIFTDDNRSITIDKHGLLGRTYDDIAEDYSGEQLRVTNNVIAFTTDNWKTLRAALGKQRYTLDGVSYEEYGVNADFCLSPKIIGGDIFSDNYSSSDNNPLGTHINLRDGTFSLAGGKLKYDGNTLTLDGKISWDNITGTENIASKQNILDSEKRLNDSLTKSNTAITESLKDLKTSIGYTQVGKDYVISPKIIGGDISGTNISGNTITGNTINNGNGTFVVDKDGNLTASSANITGVINATGGTFGGNITATGTIKGGEFQGALINNGSGTMGYIDPGMNELIKINSAVISTNGNAESVLDVNLYDFNNDGKINILDALYVNNIMSEKSDKFKFENMKIAKKSNIKFSINSNNPNKLLEITGTNMWGNTIDTYLGINRLKIPYIATDYIRSTGIHLTADKNNTMSNNGAGSPFTVSYRDKDFIACFCNGDYSDTSFYYPVTIWSNLDVTGTLSTTSGTVSQSDKNAKSDITSLDILKTSEFIYSLNPVKYKYKNGTSDRFHHGLIAQEVKESMGENDWGVYIDFNVKNEKNKTSETSLKYPLALRYEELIADLIATIQSQNNRIKALETAISK